MTPFEPQPTALSDASLTMVDLTWIEQKIEHWIKFGRPVHDEVIDVHHRTLGFAPSAIFAPVRWASNDFGRPRSCGRSRCSPTLSPCWD